MAEDSNMLTYVLLGVAAYLVYNYLESSQTAAAAALPAAVNQPSVPTSTLSTTYTTSPFATPRGPQTQAVPAQGTAQATPSTPGTMPVPTAAQLDQAATAAGYSAPHNFNLYQWNYFYTAVTGQTTAILNTYSGDANATMTSDQYIALLPSYWAQNGLSGLGRVGLVHTSALRRGAGVYGWN
jgi:hypothetical protein